MDGKVPSSLMWSHEQGNADRPCRFNVLIAMTLITSIIILCWGLMENLVSLMTFSLAYGFASGGLMPLASACVVQLSPDLEHTGLRIGIILAWCSVGVLVSGPLTGILWEKYRDELAVQWFTGGATLLGGVILIATRFWAKPQLKAVY